MKKNSRLWTPLALIICTIIVCVFLYLRPVVYISDNNTPIMVKGFKAWFIGPCYSQQVILPEKGEKSFLGESFKNRPSIQ